MATYGTHDADGKRIVTITAHGNLAELRQIIETEWPTQSWANLTLTAGPAGGLVITGPGRRPIRKDDAPARG